MDYKVERGVELPKSGSYSGKGYPFAKMTSGDFFHVALDGNPLENVRRRISSACYYTQRRTAKKFATRKYTHNGVEGVGVWCISDDSPVKLVSAQA